MTITGPRAEELPRAKIKRRLPRPAELRPLVKFRLPSLDARERRLAGAHTIDDLRAIARRRTPRSVFDYVDGAAEQEISIGRARTAFDSVELHPRVLRDVSRVDASTQILGAPAALPLVLAPTGFTRMMHHEGEIAVARAAARAGIPYVLSTMGTTDLDEVRACAPTARQWFQLYLWKDREASELLLERAVRADYEALVLTVDTPIGGARMRDVRNGLTIPPSLTLRTFAGMAIRPSWWMNILTTEPLQFAALNEFDGTVEELVGRMFDPSATCEDLRWLRARWPRKLVVKGIQSVADAKLVAELGADAIVISNHGGRQLDRAPTPLELLPRVVDAVGDTCEVLIDTGVRTGADLLAARALGASAAMVGRPYLYGLMAAGERGVDRVLEIFEAEYTRTMRLLGVVRTDEIGAQHATLRADRGR
ncbi:alpha-hydroxy acid oxidase [Nocardia cyriacigeorgica]|uniref:(S)-mandelate dehydrogenase n=1 Tax=Nocardia cyriacigeorgica TaxID=135487 RepID=A0A4U8VYD4_9NOCA|nr:alpha-hydroxy acid oxidase [Nocardia cyriacigeorgica]MBF6101178.1 alpha-hydroxy-acid oxidizing protein [Nocardia cyriacigeorgica]MBF6160590.1 alpha-hydroxy-acid oxidizing protein [Nocardia cyriacigeorgica]MBF6199643.1 alpha-hydroxy-acid oxidizing protein [Nocardia cyriacigeorgica]MBF6320058.1 alpha-hydroxy-acid oxidizing protein [Nocardia cyriacigeorgica]MBF6517082.1 alpha-hydroxy-acid oxidizing protein [Nocardia cyriacigeorgica]